jgi:dienelactone hydrolase
MFQMRHRVVGCFALAFGSMVVLASLTARAEWVAIPPQSVPGSHMPSAPLPAILTLPTQPPASGKVPFPTIILLHGCSGHYATLTDWAHRVADWGYASLIPDSYGPRGVSTNCAGPAEQRPVTPQDRAGDVVSAALWLRSRPEIDGARIGVVGFSNGGWTAMWVTQRRYEQLYPGLIKAAVSYYGNCAHPEDHGTVPLLELVGEADNWEFPAQRCREFGAQLTPEQNFEIHTYPGVVHDFDNSRMQHRAYGEGHPEQDDAAAASDSFIRARAFLDRYVGRPPN